MFGEIMIRGRLGSTHAGVVYAGQLAEQQVAVVVLSGGAEVDSFARARFEAAANALASDRTTEIVASNRDADIAPWVALSAGQGWAEAAHVSQWLLGAVVLEDVAPLGEVRGPEFRPHWYRRGGRRRPWPMSASEVLGPAGRWTFVAAFGVMVTVAVLALWIATLVFQAQPPIVPPPHSIGVTSFPPPPASSARSSIPPIL